MEKNIIIEKAQHLTDEEKATLWEMYKTALKAQEEASKNDLSELGFSDLLDYIPKKTAEEEEEENRQRFNWGIEDMADPWGNYSFVGVETDIYRVITYSCGNQYIESYDGDDDKIIDNGTTYIRRYDDDVECYVWHYADGRIVKDYDLIQKLRSIEHHHSHGGNGGLDLVYECVEKLVA